MNKLSDVQCEKVKEFIRVTRSDESIAIQVLEETEWLLATAFDHYYRQKKAWNLKQNVLLFERFRDPVDDIIHVDGIESLCHELQVDPQDIAWLVISWHMRAATMCEFSREEFIHGLDKLGIYSIEDFKERIPFFRFALQDEDIFGEIYDFAYDWAKDKGQKTMTLETAMGMWKLLFTERKWPYIDQWCEFLKSYKGKSVTRDTWTMMLEFVRSVDPVAGDYGLADGWPSMMDEFVDYINMD